MQIFLKIFSRLRIFYLAVCGKIIWLFVEFSIGDLMFRVPNVNQAEGCLRWGERSISEYLLPKKVLGTYTRIMSANGNPIRQRSHFITMRAQKKSADPARHHQFSKDCRTAVLQSEHHQ